MVLEIGKSLCNNLTLGNTVFITRAISLNIKRTPLNVQRIYLFIYLLGL